ncbi:MAG TPA: clostripain-related cysteine peptidase [Candidatus Angelobacter sp.]
MPGTNGKPTWTVMVYISADSILTNFAVESLKQLRDAANENIVVAAQFGTPEQDAMCYIFDKKSRRKSLNSDGIKKYPLNPDDITDDPATLTRFINWAYRECPKSDYYALVMWGHGPELLFEAPTGNDGGKRLYFTPTQLALALKHADKRIDIIGFDACYMSMIEYANQLHGLAGSMVASQREVPDLSFPYGTVISTLRDTENPVECCKSIVDAYVASYQDYICDTSTGAEPVTLAVLNLATVDTITRGIQRLAQELMSPTLNKRARHAIYEARTEAEGFVGGLFVDICDFCDRLQGESGEIPQQLYAAAAALSAAIRNNNPDTGCVLVNKAVRSSDCNGLSIYFPYLKDGDERDKVEQPLAKGAGGVLDGKGAGGVLDGKGAGGVLDGKAILNAAAANVRYAVRRQLINDTETYYQDDNFKFKETGWYDFIAGVWSHILAKEEPDNLDVRYSAQQCVQNLLSSRTLPARGEERPSPSQGSQSKKSTKAGGVRSAPHLTIKPNGRLSQRF